MVDYSVEEMRQLVKQKNLEELFNGILTAEID
jgi:hypothetical protein